MKGAFFLSFAAADFLIGVTPIGAEKVKEEYGMFCFLYA